MSDYEVRGGDWDWREKIAKALDGLTGDKGCGCASCEANQVRGGSQRHFGEDGGRHHAPYPGHETGWDDSRDTADWVPDFPESNPYELLRRLNESRHDPMTAREQARLRYVAEHAGDAPLDGREAGRQLQRRSFDGSNLSGREALAHLTEFRAI